MIIVHYGFLYLLCCSFRQESLSLCTGDMKIGATHPCVTADAHTGPGKAGVLTEAAFLHATEDNKETTLNNVSQLDHDQIGHLVKHSLCFFNSLVTENTHLV